MAKQQITRVKRKNKRKVTEGVAHIQATFNNTIITLTDMQGNTIGWSSAGACGFKGSRKGTPFAAQVAVEKVCSSIADFELKHVEIHVEGPGPGRESAIRSFKTQGLNVLRIIDVTPIPHNGCRPPKRRRV